MYSILDPLNLSTNQIAIGAGDNMIGTVGVFLENPKLIGGRRLFLGPTDDMCPGLGVSVFNVQHFPVQFANNVETRITCNQESPVCTLTPRT